MKLDGALVQMTKAALALNDELREGATPTRMMVLDNCADYLCRLTVAALCEASEKDEPVGNLTVEGTVTLP